MREMKDGKNNKKNLRLLQRALVLEEALGIKVRINIEEDLYVIEVQQNNPFDGKVEVKYLYWFTEETRNEFKKILKNYDKEKVEDFINRIESDIGNFIEVKSDRQQFHAREVEDTIKALERTNKHLLKICSGRLKVPSQPNQSYNYKFENPDNPLSRVLYEEVKANCEIKSKIILRSLPGLLQDLKSAMSIERRKRGRPSADTDGLAFQIASWFKEFIGSPHPFSGPFPEILERCFALVKNNYDSDRTRAIRQAIKNLSQS